MQYALDGMPFVDLKHGNTICVSEKITATSAAVMLKYLLTFSLLGCFVCNKHLHLKIQDHIVSITNFLSLLHSAAKKAYNKSCFDHLCICILHLASDESKNNTFRI